MATTKSKKDIDFKIEIGLPDGEEWSADKLAATKALVKELAAARSPERILKNKWLAVKYRMEAYAGTDEREIEKPIPLEGFLHAYLTALDISFRKFAIAIEINDANLKKYLSGDRKFNADLAKRFGRFFHCSPVTWMKVYQLNDLVQLRKERVAKKYDKYDFLKVAHHGSAQMFAGAVVRKEDAVKVKDVVTHRAAHGRSQVFRGTSKAAKK